MSERHLRGSILFLVITLDAAAGAGAQRATPSGTLPDSMTSQERANFRLMLNGAVRRNIVEAAEAMPADITDLTLSGRHRDETLTHRRVAHSFVRSLRPNGGVPADERHSTARKQAMRISSSLLSIR
jgi:hypothetical protein